MDRTMIKFRHCDRNIYCFSGKTTGCHPPGMPAVHTVTDKYVGSSHCPVCYERIKFTLLEAPVSIPSPFTNGHHVPCAFSLGSVHGPLFLGEWDDSELHIGLTNSKGVVYNYTLTGVRRDVSGWEQCICVQLVQPNANNLKRKWDRELEEFSLLATWAPERFYEEREFGSCCYAFALTFVNQMRAAEGKPILTRDEFTSKHVLPRMKTTSRYVKVYREVLKQGFYVVDGSGAELLG